ncbi:hypothetical protein J5N97_008303 [Dioscorea zingiberensis]|uniref:USP domain-containing protein n=1 Tax=Dioscorea zingiberensis TaxID=325984 RepID=A0A9D5DJ19_9LILI|nr:hypothetical protein J5N97_008303 [Dioscorea zingiberensis]
MEPGQIGLNDAESEKSLGFLDSLNDKPDLVGAALNNLGNTCFLNVVLQCITHTVPLVEKLRSVKHPRCSGFCSLCALRDHVEQSMLMSGNAICPTDFTTNLNKISSDLELGNQEDSHEFLRCFLDSVDSCCLHPRSEEPLPLEEDSLVKQIFGGRLKSQLQCSECGHRSDTFEPLLDVSLEINDVDSITEALESFFKVEKIEDEETKFTCGGCHQQVMVEKQLMLDQAPEVAALHLKRFEHNGLCIRKINKHVKFDLELDLRPFLSSMDAAGQFKYDLYAVVVHIGIFGTGHYYAFIRSSPSTWHCMDDSKVVGVSESLVLDEPAYLLFYKKQGSSPWFSSLMEAHKMSKCFTPDNTSPTSVLDFVGQNPAPTFWGESSSSSSNESQDNDEESSPITYASRSSIGAERIPSPVRTPKPVNLMCNARRADDEAPTGLLRRQVPRTPRPDESSAEIIFHEEPLADEDEACPILQAVHGEQGFCPASPSTNLNQEAFSWKACAPLVGKGGSVLQHNLRMNNKKSCTHPSMCCRFLSLSKYCSFMTYEGDVDGEFRTNYGGQAGFQLIEEVESSVKTAEFGEAGDHEVIGGGIQRAARVLLALLYLESFVGHAFGEEEGDEEVVGLGSDLGAKGRVLEFFEAGENDLEIRSHGKVLDSAVDGGGGKIRG